MTEQTNSNQEQVTSAWSIISLIGGISNFVGFPFWGALVGLIAGYIAKSEIEKGHGRIGGERLAKAGLVLGWIGMGLGLLMICLSVLMVLGVLGGAVVCGPLSALINSAQ
ncbi:MAG TPA: DUF4190 domain-containing protein [Anaerolineaceae bacterium]|nr:DUF4190 domain-containing protein [Anaerolineaceae bacterium]